MRILIGLSLTLTVLAGVPAAGIGAPAAGTHATTQAQYRLPLAGAARPVRGFAPPLQKYGAGHLGVDFAAAPGTAVLAAAGGAVRFAGSVAGRGVVVIAHPDGLSTEYEPVSVLAKAGQQVRAGQQIGRVAGRHPGCPVASCLHWGARRGQDYLDPMGLLQGLGTVRLLPWSYLGPL